MVPQSSTRAEENSPKVNLLISLGFHIVILFALVFFAAREGLLGKQLKKITVEMVKETPPPKPKEPEKPAVEARKTPPPTVVETPKIAAARAEAPKQTLQAPPAAVSAAPVAIAPAPADLPSFEFDGGKSVQTSSDPVLLYKAAVESALRSNWRRPAGISDDSYVAEVEIGVDGGAHVHDPVWMKGSGDARWDESVRRAISATKGLDRPPPPTFPPRFLVRFDVQDVTEPVAITQ